MAEDEQEGLLLPDLQWDLEKARHRFEAAREAFDRASREAPDIGLDHPDGTFLLESASRRYAHASAGYRDALFRFGMALAAKLPPP